MELFYAGLIDKQTVLEGFKFGNVGEILAKVEEEQSQVSMIDTADFQALSDETKKSVLQELILECITNSTCKRCSRTGCSIKQKKS